MRAKDLQIGKRYVLKQDGKDDVVVTVIEDSNNYGYVRISVPLHAAPMSGGTLHAMKSDGSVPAFGYLEELITAPTAAPPAPVPFSDPGDLERFRRYFAAPGFSFSSFA